MTGPETDPASEHHATPTSDPRESDHSEASPDSLRVEVTSLSPGASRTRRLLAWGQRRRWVRAVQGASVIVLVLALLYVLVLPHPSLSNILPPPAPTPLRYTSQPLTCPAGATWSPDSRRFAVVHYLNCDRNYPDNNTGGVLAIYSLATGPIHPQTVIPLDTVVVHQGLPQSVTSNAQEMRTLRLQYTSVSWSPDGRSIAVTYGGGYAAPVPSAPVPSAPASGAPVGGPPSIQGDSSINGLLLVPTTNTSNPVRVFSQPAPEPTSYPAPLDPSTPYSLDAWNVRVGKQIVYTIPRSLAYRWGPDDELVATAPLSLTSEPAVSPGPVGNSAGGQAFTLWQSAYIQVSNAACIGSPVATQPTPTSAEVYAAIRDESFISLGLETGAPVWSPDGEIYIPQGIYSGGRADVPFPATALDASAACTYQGPPSSQPLIPPHDAALRTILSRVTAASNIVLYWRPDGQRLVLQESPVTNEKGTGAQYTLTVYDCATGQVLATPNTPGSLSGLFGAPSISWSPNGQNLLLVGYAGVPVSVLSAVALGG